MSTPTNRDYLQQKINTASSAQLHLMLIEGAIRFAVQADKAYEANDAEAAAAPLVRAIDIVAEMNAGVKHSEDELNVKLAALYQFLITRLTMAYVNTDREKLAESIAILEYERETWRQACEQAAKNDAPLKGPHKPAPLHGVDPVADGGLSLEV